MRAIFSCLTWILTEADSVLETLKPGRIKCVSGAGTVGRNMLCELGKFKRPLGSTNAWIAVGTPATDPARHATMELFLAYSRLGTGYL